MFPDNYFVFHSKYPALNESFEFFQKKKKS